MTQLAATNREVKLSRTGVRGLFECRLAGLHTRWMPHSPERECWSREPRRWRPGRAPWGPPAPRGAPLAEPFALFFAVNAVRTNEGVLDRLVDGWLRDGVFLVATWGPGCERLHDRIDGADVELDIDEPDTSPGTVLTTWHDHETATEALLSTAGLSACEDRPDGRLLLVLIDDRVDAGDLVHSALDNGATWTDVS